jgi:hypothetical protein
MKTLVLSSLLALAALFATPASAQEVQNETERTYRLLDLGVSTGWNNPAGYEGVEADFRVLDYVSVGLGAGNAMWGFRLTPQARVYPFGISRAGLFLEAGLSLNTGGSAEVTTNGATQTADLLLTPAANVALGYRWQFGKWVSMALRAGWSFSLRNDNVAVRGGGDIDPALKLVTDASSPGGPIVGLTAGVALF